MPVGCAHLSSSANSASFMFGIFELEDPDFETFGHAILGLKEDSESAIVVSRPHKLGRASAENGEFMFGNSNELPSVVVADESLLDLWAATLA